MVLLLFSLSPDTLVVSSALGDEVSTESGSDRVTTIRDPDFANKRDPPGRYRSWY